MQRKNFQITVNGVVHSVMKHAWNAAVRETEKIARDTAAAKNEILELIDSKSFKSGFYFVSGIRVWKGPTTNLVMKIEELQ